MCSVIRRPDQVAKRATGIALSRPSSRPGKAPGSIECGHTCSEEHPRQDHMARCCQLQGHVEATGASQPPPPRAGGRCQAARVNRRRNLGPWPLATAGQGGMLTASASRHQARQATLATGGDVLARSDGPIGTNGRRCDRHATRATWRATLTGAPQNPRLRRLTSIQDGTVPGASDSLAEPTMAARPISRRSAASPPTSWQADV
jgi:hypothetical protein